MFEILQLKRFLLYITFFEVVWHLVFTRKSAAKQARLYLQKIENESNGRFRPSTFKKIVDSYSLYLPIVMDAFTSLNGRLTNDLEKHRTLHYFILSSLFDDFVDDSDLTDDQIRDFVLEDLMPDNQHFDQIICRNTHLYLVSQVVQKHEYLQTITHVMQAQLDSKRQKNLDLSFGELEKIVLYKGGYSVLLCHYYIEDSDEAWKPCWFLLGGLIQLTNDLFDIHKDIKDGILTLPIKSKYINNISCIYNFQFHQLLACIESLSSQNTNKIRFRIALFGTYAFGLVAIENLKKIVSKEGILPDLETVERQKLIVDMSKWSNIKLWLKFVHSLAKEHC